MTGCKVTAAAVTWLDEVEMFVGKGKTHPPQVATSSAPWHPPRRHLLVQGFSYSAALVVQS